MDRTNISSVIIVGTGKMARDIGLYLWRKQLYVTWLSRDGARAEEIFLCKWVRIFVTDGQSHEAIELVAHAVHLVPVSHVPGDIGWPGFQDRLGTVEASVSSDWRFLECCRRRAMGRVDLFLHRSGPGPGDGLPCKRSLALVLGRESTFHLFSWSVIYPDISSKVRFMVACISE